MEYKGLSLQEAVDFVVKERLDEGQAGMIAVSKKGEVAYGFNCNESVDSREQMHEDTKIE
ncbi:hypothetical protein L1049_026834 [Liquidambar formosana]|uniref:Uncharacterized protein n=1 Tax=Liquidambar formosana TaxID=63359 RepID=A0AAP0R7N1_LIQFO